MTKTQLETEIQNLAMLLEIYYSVKREVESFRGSVHEMVTLRSEEDACLQSILDKAKDIVVAASP